MLSFVDVAGESNGLMIANNGLTIYEVKDDEKRTIAVTLLRCTDRLYSGPFSTSEDMRIPEAQCIGEYTFRYSVIPHTAGWEDAYPRAYEYQFPLEVVLQRTPEDALLPDYQPMPAIPDNHSFVEMKSNSNTIQAVVSTVKKHESRDSLMLRLLNLQKETVSTAVRTNAPHRKVCSVFQTDLQEKRIGTLTADPDGWLELDIKAKQFITVEFAF